MSDQHNDEPAVSEPQSAGAVALADQPVYEEFRAGWHGYPDTNSQLGPNEGCEPMGSRHRKPMARRIGRLPMLVGGGLLATALVALAAWSLAAVLASTPPVPVVQAATPTGPTHPINQDGRIVAMTDTSVTAVGADGISCTFLVTPDTTAVTSQGGRDGAAGQAFAVNDEVSIVGEIRNGTPVATAVAARAVTELAGPPMDFPAT